MTAPTRDILDRKTLEDEYQRLASDIRGIETGNDKAVALGLTVIGAGFAYGIKENVSYVFPFLPVALIGVFLYGTLQYHNLFWLGGYKRAVEEKINELAGRTVICWEDLVEHRRKRVNVINVGLTLVYVAVLVAMTGISSDRTIKAFGPAYGMASGIVDFGLAVLLILGFRRMFRGYDDALTYGRKKLLFAISHNELEKGP